MALSLATVLGMVLAIAGRWLFGGELAFLDPLGLALVYVAGGCQPHGGPWSRSGGSASSTSTC